MNYSLYQGQQEKHLPQEPSVFMDQLYGTKYQTMLGPQQTTAPSKENLKHIQISFQLSQSTLLLYNAVLI